MALGPHARPGARGPEQRITAADVHAVRFGKPPFGRRGYDEGEVDEFLRLVSDALAQPPGSTRITGDRVHEIAFRKPKVGSRGYDEDEVDAFLDLIEAELRWRESAEGRQERMAVEQPPPAPVRTVRATAVAVIVDRGRLLVVEMPDPVGGRVVYRPPGTDVAFGERGQETVVRALREDFGIPLTDVRPLATLESIYRFGGRDGHELVLVYSAAPTGPGAAAQQRLVGRHGDLSAVWVPIEAFRRGEAALLPEGLLALLG
jgi:DivIVA domain-containing protein